MGDYLDMEEYYNSYNEQAYQDYLDESFHEFLSKIKTVCMLSRTYTQPNHVNDIKSFWEVR